MISMNDIICPEVNFNSAFVLPGSRHWKSGISQVLGSQSPPNIDPKLLQINTEEESNASDAVRDYKFLVRTKDNGYGIDTEVPLQHEEDDGATKEDADNASSGSTRFHYGIRSWVPRKRGSMNRYSRGNGVLKEPRYQFHNHCL